MNLQTHFFLGLFFFLVHHVKNLEVASSSYQKVLEENRNLYNQVQDLKGDFIAFLYLYVYIFVHIYRILYLFMPFQQGLLEYIVE